MHRQPTPESILPPPGMTSRLALHNFNSSGQPAIVATESTERLVRAMRDAGHSFDSVQSLTESQLYATLTSILVGGGYA